MWDPDFCQFVSAPLAKVLNFGSARIAFLDIQSGFWGIHRQSEALIGVCLTDSVFQQADVNGGASFVEWQNEVIFCRLPE